MTTVTGDTLVFYHRLVLNLVSSNFGCDLGMAIQTDFSGFAFEEFILFRSMRDMADIAITFCKGRMSRLFHLLVSQLCMAGQAEFASIRCHVQHSGYFTAVWSMTADASTYGKGPMLPVKTFLRLGITVTFKTKLRQSFCQQCFQFRFVRIMTIKAEALLCRCMRVRGIRIGVFGVTRITEVW